MGDADESTLMIQRDNFDFLDKKTGKLLWKINNDYQFKYVTDPMPLLQKVYKGKLLVGVDSDYYVLYDLKTGKKLKQWDKKPSTVILESKILSPLKKFCAAKTSQKNLLYLWTTSDWKVYDSIRVKQEIEDVIFGPHDKQLLLLSWESIYKATLYLWDLTKKEIVYKRTYGRTTSPFLVNSKAWCFSPDGKTFLSVTKDKLCLFEVATGKLISTQPFPDQDIHHIYPLPNGKKLLTFTEQGIIKLWRIKDLKLLGTIFLNSSSKSWIITTPDNRFDANKAGLKRMFWAENSKILTLPKAKQVKNLWQKLIR